MGELVNSIYKDSSLNYYKPVFANYENVTDGKVIDRTDLDKDGVKDQQDLCDNTSLGIKVDMFGCEKEQINSDKNENSDLKLENNTSFKTITPYLENITNKPS